MVDRLVRMAKDGANVGITAMPVAGVSTPVTVEGFIAVAAAEVVAARIAARAINPSVPLGGLMWAGTVDMATGGVSYSAYDAMYNAFAVCEFIRRWTGINFPPGSGEYCDAKEPGMYATLEKHYKAMTVAAFTGHHPGLGQGMLECGKIIAPVQLIIERDFAAAMGKYGREIAPTADNLGLPTIFLHVYLGLKSYYLQSLHTLEHFRAGSWLPQLANRWGWSGPQQDEILLDRAQQKVEQLLAQYVKPQGRDYELAKLRAVMERASRNSPIAAGQTKAGNDSPATIAVRCCSHTCGSFFTRRLTMRKFIILVCRPISRRKASTYVAATKVFVTDPNEAPAALVRRSQADAYLTGPVRDMPHIAFATDYMGPGKYQGSKVPLGPFEAMPGLRVIFVEKDGAVFEFMEFAEGMGWGASDH